MVSEKAIAIANWNIVDESSVTPSLSARVIARFWMRILWGYVLGPLCHLKPSTVRRLRTYPLEFGGCHKQVALERTCLAQALMFGSEGGIDGSNLPYLYVCLPLPDVEKVARRIRDEILKRLGKDVKVIITDTDKTYSFGGFHFAPRQVKLGGIHDRGGLLAYLIGRAFGLRRRATPLAVAGCKLDASNALRIADLADHARGYGAGRTVWDMANRFETGLSGVSWEMLNTVKHKPIVLVRTEKTE